jgi:hypothetical protein
MLPVSNALLNIAENATTVFITIDKSRNPQQAEHALQALRYMYDNLKHIPFVDDDEQAELEAILDAQSDDDKEIASVKYGIIEL